MAKQDPQSGKGFGTRAIKSATAIVASIPEHVGTNHSGAQDVIAGRGDEDEIATSGNFAPENKRLNDRT